MIPHIAQRGHSFKGAGLYYLHDKQADTSERVVWTATRNLPTQDAEIALKCMAYTDMEAKRQREESSGAGRKQTAGNVFSYSLSWHPDQQPDRQEMEVSALVSLQRLGLLDHQAVLVAHCDTAHAHVHVVVNLVHPESGKVADLSYSKRKLQAWASEYEHADGMVYCEERERNAQRRENGEITKYQDERVVDAPSITELYQQSDSGASFVAALAEQGYALAHGDRGRLVIVDADGAVQNLVRQIDGVKKRDIEAKLGEVLESLPTLAEVQAMQREYEESAILTTDTPVESVSVVEAQLHEGEELSEIDDLKQLVEQHEKELVASVSSKCILEVHVAAIGRLPQGERSEYSDSGDALVRVLESEQERSGKDGFARIHAVHYGEVGIYAVPSHAEYMEQHSQVQALREERPSLWHEVVQGVCRLSQSVVCAVVREGIRHPERFNQQLNNGMQRVAKYVQDIWHTVQTLPERVWNTATQRRVDYLSRVRSQYHAEDHGIVRNNNKQRNASGGDAPQRQVSPVQLALMRMQEDRER